ncbi:MAG: ISAs1 family transposase [Planctomycetota bacterium]
MRSLIGEFHDCFDRVEDVRVQGRVVHPMNSILFLIVTAVIADCDGPEEIEEFGNDRLDWLSQFADFSEGIPSHDTIGRVLPLIKPDQFQTALLQWHHALRQRHATLAEAESDSPTHVAIDGKTARGSYTDAEKSNAIHLVSAWATEHGIALGQTQVDSRSNEIAAIPDLLEFINVRDSIVTLDAIGAQKSIAAQIVEEKGDYVFALKDNHPKLADVVRQHFEEVHSEGLVESGFRSKTDRKKRASREEERFYAVGPIPKSMKALTDQWPGAKSIGQAITTTERAGITREEVRYYISSRPALVGEFANCVRNHWRFESMHWILDMVFHEDASRVRTKNAASNLSFSRRFATTLLKRDTYKRSIKGKRKKAARNSEFLQNVLFAA